LKTLVNLHFLSVNPLQTLGKKSVALRIYGDFRGVFGKQSVNSSVRSGR
jgi:hypothetical protein